ncbi:peptidase [Brevibacterium yomogidense]|uniref:peptidase n=1 Tax=Brevibacterium yomogidense TaxID=946573 RepID=UPI0018E04EA0|nr:peptidase [Brevibacterium yomogidense]
MIDWLAFVEVFAVSLVCAGVGVFFYSLGLRLLVSGGRPPVVPPAEFPDAIAVRSDKQAARIAKKVKKVASRSPLTRGQQRLLLAVAYACFGVCALAVIGAVLYLMLY